MANPLPEQLPDLPRNALILIGRDQWDWLTTGLRLTYLAVRAQTQPPAQDQTAVLKALATITQKLEFIVAQNDNLSDATDRIEAAQTASDAASAEDMRQLRAAIDALAAVPNTDAVAARLSAVADRIEARTAEQVANDPAPAPEA